MKREYFLISLFFLVTAVIFYLFYQIVVPFFAPIAWAMVFVILFYPLYERTLLKVRRAGFASLLVCSLIVILILGPITYLFVALVNEAADAVAKVNALYKSGQLDQLLAFDIPGVQSLKEKLAQYYDISQIDLDAIVKDAIDKVSGVMVQQTTWLVANGTRTVFYFGLMLFTMYYFFKDGEEIVNKIKRLMPLSEAQVELTVSQMRDVINATVYGGLVIALIQGVLGGLLFYIVGIPSPIFWGVMMAFLSILPLVGAFIIYLPAGLLLMLTGNVVTGIIVIVIGTVVISQVDNVVRPMLIAGRTSLHPLLLFFTILGGISVFGLLGVIIGPMIAAMFTILLRVFDLKLHPEDISPPAESTSA